MKQLLFILIYIYCFYLNSLNIEKVVNLNDGWSIFFLNAKNQGRINPLTHTKLSKLQDRRRDNKLVNTLLKELRQKATENNNIMEISIKCAHAGITTGEWSNVMREVFGEYRAPTGIVSSSIKKQKIKIEIYAPMGSNNDLNILKEIKRYKLNFFKLSDRHFKH